jgi:hypothetical protein
MNRKRAELAYQLRRQAYMDHLDGIERRWREREVAEAAAVSGRISGCR